MNLKKLSFLLLLLFVLFNSIFVYSQYDETKIFGFAPDYAGTELVFYTYSDYITHAEKVLDSCTVLPDGSFTIKINTEEDISIFTVLGIYNCKLIIEKNTNYEITLPPKTGKTYDQLINPYYKEKTILLMPADTSMVFLSMMVEELKNDINVFIAEHQREIITQRLKKSEIQKFIQQTDIKYSSASVSLNSFKKYEFGSFKQMLSFSESKKISNEFFKKQPVLYKNSSYMWLFNDVFDRFLSLLPTDSLGVRATSIIIGKGRLSSLKTHITENSNFVNDSLVELLIMKGLYDGFYNNIFLADEVNHFLDLIIKKSEIEESKIIANNIKTKINSLLYGSKAPDFNLLDPDSVTVNLRKFRGKYIYLNFCSYKSFSSKQEFETMKILYDRFKTKIEFVSISVDESFDEFCKYMDKEDYKWTMLDYQNQPEIIKSYKVKAYPTFFLIDPYGKIILAPALKPSDNFENQFYGILNKRN